MRIREITMTEDQAELLRQECDPTASHEGACQILCGLTTLTSNPWDSEGDSDLRLTLHRVELIPNKFVRKSPQFVSWDMDCFIKLLRKAREMELHPGICHSHPNSDASFSNQDDTNERHLQDVLRKRNKNHMLTSILFRGDNVIEARVWFNHERYQSIAVRVLGTTVEEFTPSTKAARTSPRMSFLHRQVLAVGEEKVARLQSLRVAVVGCGGTGSAVAILLARAGVGSLLLLDPDIVSRSNLNRLHGSTHYDVERRKPKVQVLQDHIQNMGLGTKVATIRANLSDSNTARSLLNCDCIFGCTDDHLGRLILNRIAYFYFLPVIDTGLAVEAKSKYRPSQITGRVTVLRPGNPCLLCRGRISGQRAREQGLRLKHKDEYVRQKKEGYITGQDIPTPVVGSFTTETAASAVNEFLAGFASLRGARGWSAERTIRYDLDRVRPTGCKPNQNCPVCDDKSLWGIGDVEPFLDLANI